MPIELVVFDLAGTTVKDLGEITIAFQMAMKEFGYDIPKPVIGPLMGYKKTEAIRMMLDEFEPDEKVVTQELIDAIHQSFIDAMVEYYETADAVVPFEEAESVFATLKSKGIKIGLDTGFPHSIASVIVNKLGWLNDGKVDCLVCSDEVPLGRPHPYMIEKIMHQTGVHETQRVIKVGDTEVDINEGINANCKYSIGITTGAFSGAELAPYEPSFIIHQLHELIPIVESVA